MVDHDAYNAQILQTCEVLEEKLRICTTKPEPLSQAPRRTYTASTTVTASYEGREVGPLRFILFGPNEATGSTKDYRHQTIVFPEWADGLKPKRNYTPRNRLVHFANREPIPLPAEFIFPVLTQPVQGNIVPNIAHLTRLKLTPALEDEQEEGKDWALIAGPELPQAGFGCTPSNSCDYTPRQFALTCRHIPGEEPYGTPHAMLNWGEQYTIAGFLPVRDPNHPILALADREDKTY